MRDSYRSWLFVPGSIPKMLARIPALSADAIIVDLEDAVAPDDKIRARVRVAKALATEAYRKVTLFVRINGIETGMAETDLEAVVGDSLTGIMLPKAETASQVTRLDEVLSALEEQRGLAHGSVAIALLVETARGVLNAPGLGLSRRVVALVLGGEDLSLSLRAQRSKAGGELAYARGVIVTAAAAANVQAIDTIWTDLTDLDGLRQESLRMRSLGFSGKLAIHPRQTDVIETSFSPTPEELQNARLIVDAFAAGGGKAICIHGKMVDVPVVARARALLNSKDHTGLATSDNASGL